MRHERAKIALRALRALRTRYAQISGAARRSYHPFFSERAHILQRKSPHSTQKSRVIRAPVRYARCARHASHARCARSYAASSPVAPLADFGAWSARILHVGMRAMRAARAVISHSLVELACPSALHNA